MKVLSETNYSMPLFSQGEQAGERRILSNSGKVHSHPSWFLLLLGENLHETGGFFFEQELNPSITQHGEIVLTSELKIRSRQ